MLARAYAFAYARAAMALAWFSRSLAPSHKRAPTVIALATDHASASARIRAWYLRARARIAAASTVARRASIRPTGHADRPPVAPTAPRFFPPGSDGRIQHRMGLGLRLGIRQRWAWADNSQLDGFQDVD
jgi:hypothetical protein